MENRGIHFIERSLPDRVEKQSDGKLRVDWTVNNVTKKSDVFDTVLFATGRRACTDALNLSGSETVCGAGLREDRVSPRGDDARAEHPCDW